MAVNPHTTVNYLLEQAYQAIITNDPNIADLLETPVHLGMDSADLETTHVAIIVPSLKYSEGQPMSGNWQMDVHVKVVTAFDDSQNPLPDGFTSLRDVHEQRAGYIQDLSWSWSLTGFCHHQTFPCRDIFSRMLRRG